MKGLRTTFLSQLRTTFLRGVALMVPLVLTFWVFRALLDAVDGVFSPYLEEWIGQRIPGLGFITMLVLILLVGLLTRNLIGTLLFSWFENVLRSIPFVRSVYGAIKDLVSGFATGGKGKTFRQVVMAEYPRKGLYCIGFVTNEMSFTAANGAQIEFFNVYIPNPPNPTSGFLALIPKEEAIQLDLSVEDGLKLVLSGGIILPETIAAKQITYEREIARGTETSSG